MILYNEATERAVLGGAMLSQVLPQVEADDFYSGKNGRIWGAIVELHKDNAPVDIITVTSKLRDYSRLWEGGAEYIAALTNEVPGLAHMEHHATRLRELGHARRLKEAAKQVAQAIDQGEEPSEAAIKFQQVLASSSSGEYVPQKIGDLYAERTDHYEALYNKEKKVGINTGLTDLDRKVPIADSDLVMILGRPAMGKTALGMSVAHGVSKHGRPVLYFNGEMSNEQLTDREVSKVSKVDGRKMRTGEFTIPDMQALARSAGLIGSLPFYIIRATRMTSGKVRAATAAFIARHGVKPVVIVDLLNAMREYKTNDRQAMFSDSVLGLKDTATDLNLPVILLGQLGRKVEERNPPIPMISDAKETGEAEQTSDTLLLLYRQDYYEEQGTLKKVDPDLKGVGRVYVGKSRHGPTGWVDLEWSGENTTYRNLSTQYEKHYTNRGEQ